MNKSSNLPPTSARREGWFNKSARYHFARLVSDLTSLETPLREALQNALLPGETICWMIDAPYQGLLPKDAARRKPGFSLHFLPIPLPWVFTPDWILALTAQRLLLMQTSVPGKEPKVAAVPLENILFLRSGGILLFSWLEVHWVESGKLFQETIYFNTVCEPLFTRLTEMIRRSQVDSGEAPAARGLGALDPLPYKFMNLIPLRLLLPEEGVDRVLYRPAMWRQRLKFFRSMTAPRMALVRTQWQMVLAEEDLSGEEGSYGLISTFLPLKQVRSLSYQLEKDHLLLVISLALLDARQEIQIPFPLDREEDLHSFIQ